MAGILSSASVLLRFISNVEEQGLAKGTLATLEDKKVTLAKADGSMMKLMGKYIVEPIAVVSNDLKDVEELDHILGLHADMFTSYYMQVFDILRNVYDVNVETAVDTLATDNGGLMRVLTKGLETGIELNGESEDLTDYIGMLCSEANYPSRPLPVESTPGYKGTAQQTEKANKAEAEKYVYDLARYQNDVEAAEKSHLNKTSYESKHAEDIRVAEAERTRKRLKGVDPSKRIYHANKDLVRDPASLHGSHKDLLIPNAVQRVIAIKVDVTQPEPGTDGKFHTTTFTIPVTIKLGVIFTSDENIKNAISTQSDEYTFSSRLDEYRAGSISLVDFLTASDLIKKYKAHRLKDKDMLGTIMVNRELSATSKIVANGFAGFERFYNMFIVSPTTKEAIEKDIRTKITSNHGKQKFLEAANGLSLTLVDPDYERIQIRLKDVNGKTDLSFRNAIKKDKNSSDYGELIKAMMANKPPVF